MEALEIYRRPVVLFDFDGTVADTGRAVMTSTRKALTARGFSEAQMGDLRRMIGPPLWKSFHDFYGFSREESLVVADSTAPFLMSWDRRSIPCSTGSPSCSMACRARASLGSGDVAHGGKVHLTWCVSWGFASSKPWSA